MKMYLLLENDDFPASHVGLRGNISEKNRKVHSSRNSVSLWNDTWDTPWKINGWNIIMEVGKMIFLSK